MNIVPEDLLQGVKNYLVSTDFNRKFLDKCIKQSPPGEDFISLIINKKMPRWEILLLLDEWQLDHINYMVRDHRLKELLGS